MKNIFLRKMLIEIIAISIASFILWFPNYYWSSMNPGDTIPAWFAGLIPLVGVPLLLFIAVIRTWRSIARKKKESALYKKIQLIPKTIFYLIILTISLPFLFPLAVIVMFIIISPLLLLRAIGIPL